MSLLEVARENDAERKKMLSILQLEPTRRKMAINILVTEMERKNAPPEFIEAWDSLQDDALAEAARSVIEEGALEGKVDRRVLYSGTIGLGFDCASGRFGLRMSFNKLGSDSFRIRSIYFGPPS